MDMERFLRKWKNTLTYCYRMAVENEKMELAHEINKLRAGQYTEQNEDQFRDIIWCCTALLSK